MRKNAMSAHFRFLSQMVGLAAVLSLMVMMAGTRAQAQSMAITDFSYTGSPGGYYDVTDTVHVGLEFDNIAYSGGYGYTILAYTYYYAGANGSGTLLQTTTTSLYSHSAPLTPGNNYISDYVNLNTPDILRASEPAGTQSFRYVYILQAGGGGPYWSRQATTGGPTNLVHG
jgi:hypothetical protein